MANNDKSAALVNLEVADSIKEFRSSFPESHRAIDVTFSNLIWKLNDYLNKKGPERVLTVEGVKAYSCKIENDKNTDYIEVPTEVGIPILEKLSYVRCPNIRKIYVDILYKASYSKNQELVHPRLVNLIPSLSNQDVLFLKELYQGNVLEMTYRHRLVDVENRFISSNVTDYFPRQLEAAEMTPQISLSNLRTLGILEERNGLNIDLHEECKAYLERNFNTKDEQFKFEEKYFLKNESELAKIPNFIPDKYSYTLVDIKSYQLSYLGSVFLQLIED